MSAKRKPAQQAARTAKVSEERRTKPVIQHPAVDEQTPKQGLRTNPSKDVGKAPQGQTGGLSTRKGSKQQLVVEMLSAAAGASGTVGVAGFALRARPCFQARNIARTFPGDIPCRSARIPCFCSSGAWGSSSSTIAAASGSAWRRFEPRDSVPFRAGNNPAVVSTLSVLRDAPMLLRPGVTSAVTTRLSHDGSVRTRGVFISCSVLPRSAVRRFPAIAGRRDA